MTMETLEIIVAVTFALMLLLIFWPRPVRRRKRRTNRSYNSRGWWKSRELY